LRAALGYASGPMSTRHVVATCCAVLLAAGCQQAKEQAGTSTATPQAAAPTEESTEIIATYAGKKLTGAEVLSEIDRLPGPSRAYLSAPDRKRQFVENLVLNDLLFAEAQRAGYDKDPDIQKQVDDMRKRLVVQRLMREYQKPPEVSDDEAKKYYDDHPDLYSGTQIHASHILVRDEATAKKVHDALVADPSKFTQAAKEISIDKASGAKGGDLGTFGQGRMVPEFEAVAFALKPGQISDIVKTQYGYHIILVTERKEGERKPLDQVKDQIKTMLRNRQMQDAMQTKFEALKKAADVKIDESALAKITPPPAPTGPTAMPLPLGH
jgi:peptidyl-prolyl cis-trans isomerase C